MLKIIQNLVNFFKNTANIFKQQEKSFKFNVVRVILAHFFIYLVLPLQSIYVISLGLSPAQLGWVTGSAGIIGGVVSFLAAKKVKTYSLKNYFLMTLLCISVGSFLLAIAKNTFMASLGIGTFMFSWYAMMHLCPAVCGLCLNNDIRVTAMQTCDMLASLPKVVAPMVGSSLVIAFRGKQNITSGIPFLYYIATLGFCLTFILVWKWFSDPNFLIRTREMNFDRQDVDRSGGIQDLFKQRKGTNLKLLVLTLSLIQVPWFISTIFVPLFAQQAKGANALTIGLMQSAFWGCTLLLAIPAGRLADRIGRKSSITIFLVISIIAFLCLIAAQSQLVLIISGFLQGFLFFSLVTSGGMSAESVPKMFIVEWFGFQGLIKGLMAQLGPVIGGTLWGFFGPYSAIFLMIGCQLAAILLLRMLPETQGGLSSKISVSTSEIIKQNLAETSLDN